jgi:two-component system phosphate regulon sensor histidine kinase PhoR
MVRRVTPFAIVGFVAVLTAGLLISGLFKQHYLDDVRDRLQREVDLLAESLEIRLAGGMPLAGCQALADDWHRLLGLRVTVIDTQGVVVAESGVPADSISFMENHGSRPEVVSAWKEDRGSSIRHSVTLDADMMYISRAVRLNGAPVAILRVGMSLGALVETQERIGNLLLSIFVAAVVLVFTWSAWISLRSERSLRQLALTAGHLSSGNWEARVPIDPYRPADEYSDVAHAFNSMADELKARYEQRRRERDQLQTVLTNMSDGVLALDGEGTVRLVNQAFLRFFRSVFDDPIGHRHTEAFRDRELNELIGGLLGGNPVDRHELELTTPGRRIIVLRTAAIPQAGRQDVRGVVVARDVTARRRVEQMRRDFVANVSHELRTPLTAITGYVEALHEEHLAATEREMFLQTISRNAERMNNIVSDLLELSRIEDPDFHPSPVDFALGPVADEIEAALANGVQAKGQTLTIAIEPAAHRITADRDAVARILLNLVDNAHKYSGQQGTIALSARREGPDVALTVSDDGPGVPEADRPRLFERFFRVDRARSRDSGGTGLGLAIVKHLVESHGGTVAYEPEDPHGSRFIVRLPQPVGSPPQWILEE